MYQIELQAEASSTFGNTVSISENLALVSDDSKNTSYLWGRT